MLGLGEVDEDDLYTALDWLLERQPAIERVLAKRHLSSGTLVLYDVRRATWKAIAVRWPNAAIAATAGEARSADRLRPALCS